MQLYFSPAFREAHAASLSAKSAAQTAARAGLERGRRELKGERDPVPVESHAVEIWIGVAAFALLVLGCYKLLRVPTISAKVPYRFRIGFARYTIEAASGVIANYTHREVSGPAPGLDYNPWPSYRPVRATVTLEAYEDFTLDEAGHSEPIHLAFFYPGAGLPIFRKDIGHRRTALWTTIGGERRYLGIQGPRGPDPTPAGTGAPLFPRPTWTVVPALMLGFVVGDLVVASEYSGVLAVFVALALWGGLMKVLIWRVSGAFGTRLVALGKRLHEAA